MALFFIPKGVQGKEFHRRGEVRNVLAVIQSVAAWMERNAYADSKQGARLVECATGEVTSQLPAFHHHRLADHVTQRTVHVGESHDVLWLEILIKQDEEAIQR